ncbi:MAG: glycoside hydrolase family 2 [Erysipelotrichaceae bacterium]|nr:glycoside hydrolase family 2 [Erysipelotrichaceae bacterium]
MNLKDAIKTVQLFKKKEELKEMYTPWGENIDEEHILEEYPRPQMRRRNYTMLNGLWSYAFSKHADIPKDYEGEILVPFSPESLLSKVKRQLQPHEYLWYKKEFDVEYNDNKRLILHFGAVDQICDIYINSNKVFHHIGGYLPFEIDITDYLLEHNELIVCVQDFSDKSYHAKGKQRLKNGGMYYTAQSGIWQSVWYEWVDEIYIKDVHIVPDYDNDCIKIYIDTNAPLHSPITFQIDDQPVITQDLTYENVIPVLHKVSWTPDYPHLYYLKINLEDDEVICYFAMRCFTIEKDEQNIPRICLNHHPLFLHGVLDQGYYSDGLYTPPSDEAIINDIQQMKDLGFNTIRKHCKIESARWYYHCDHMGMIVMQDMINGGEAYHTWYVTYMPTLFQQTQCFSDKLSYLLARDNETGKQEFEQECLDTIDALSYFPSIACWVLFNEGWGQFDTCRLTDVLREKDPTRLIDSSSGWFDQGCGDFKSEHHYFDEPTVPVDERAYLLSEYGGFILKVENHVSVEASYGYQTYENVKDLQEAFKNYKDNILKPLIPKGLCGAIYTQLSDIEEEINGILTYDRKVNKFK